MYEDKLVEEVRKRAEELMSRYDFDINKIYKMLKEREEKAKDRIVSQIVVVPDKEKVSL